MVRLVIILSFTLSCIACNNSTKNGVFYNAIHQQIKQFDSLKLSLELSGYKNQSGFSDTLKNPNWEQALEPFLSLNYENFSKENNLITDTIFDERSNRYLVRGTNLEEDPSSTYLILDSTFQLIQFSLKSETAGFWKHQIKEYFWDKEGTFTYIYNYRIKGGEWNEYHWIGKVIQ